MPRRHLTPDSAEQRMSITSEEQIMRTETTFHSGCVATIWRYPVKSMIGEELDTVAVTERGLDGDRAFALVDPRMRQDHQRQEPKGNGAICSRSGSDLPRRQTSMVRFQPLESHSPTGRRPSSADLDIDERLSDRLGPPPCANRSLRTTATAPRVIGRITTGSSSVTRPSNSNCQRALSSTGAPIQLVTTATLDRLTNSPLKVASMSRGFRPNFVIEFAGSTEGFIENDWVGRTILIGSQVRILVARPTLRCVMTTLAQGSLPKDPEVLRAAVQNNQGNVGVYATVVRGGMVRRGNAVALE